MSSKSTDNAHGGLLKRHPEIVLGRRATLRQAIEAMTQSRVGFALVVGDKQRLLGVLSDGDIRKALLKSNSMDIPVIKAMNPDPLTVPEGLSEAKIADVFRSTAKFYIPVIGKNRRLVGLAALSDYEIISAHYPNTVVLMAGGLGKRLGSLTQDTPKPLLPIGGRPILEVLMEQFKSSGFTNFLFAVNHFADQIIRHFGDGSRWGVKIKYLREKAPLGTVGALSLISKSVREPIFVANGDILTKIDFARLLDFHKTAKASATLCIKPHEIQVPYGVVEIDGYQLRGFTEKPTHRTYINGGVYVFEPEVLRLIPKGRRCDMPELIATLKTRKKRVACFAIQEYWLDIGELQSYERAAKDYVKLF